MRRIVTATLATAFLAVAVVPPVSAQEGKPASARQDEPKQITAQQQKMKDCAAKWKDEKAKTNVKGREAYSKFMSGCLKTDAAG